MGLRDVESKLPPGFRFYPSDEELVCHYLYKKVNNKRVSGGTMVEVDLHTREPWELPEVAKLSANEWYFFSFRDRKYATGSRTNRATRTGYWKATGKDRTVHEPLTRAIVGMRKTLVFYGGRAPNGIKTGWVMHEFRLETPNMPPKEDWVLCRVFHKRKGESVSSGQVNYSSTIIGCSSPYMEMESPPPPVDNQHQGGLMPNIGYDDHQLAAFTSSAAVSQYNNNNNNNNNNNSPNTTLLNMAVLHYNLLESPTQNIDANSGAAVGTNSRFGDEYGSFLFDVALADQEMAEAAMVNLDEMRLYQNGKKDHFF